MFPTPPCGSVGQAVLVVYVPSTGWGGGGGLYWWYMGLVRGASCIGGIRA